MGPYHNGKMFKLAPIWLAYIYYNAVITIYGQKPSEYDSKRFMIRRERMLNVIFLINCFGRHPGCACA